MSVLLVTWWNRLCWEKIDTWQHPQPTSIYCRKKLPYFFGHVPQESGTRVGGSLSENWTKIPRHDNKNSHWRELRMLILDLWTFYVNEVHKKNWWRGVANVCFEWIVMNTSTSVAILSWVHTIVCRTYLLQNTQ